jgi:hypothetical protein
MRYVNFWYGVLIGLCIYWLAELLEWSWRNTGRIEINRDHPYR